MIQEWRSGMSRSPSQSTKSEKPAAIKAAFIAGKFALGAALIMAVATLASKLIPTDFGARPAPATIAAKSDQGVPRGNETVLSPPAALAAVSVQRAITRRRFALHPLQTPLKGIPSERSAFPSVATVTNGGTNYHSIAGTAGGPITNTGTIDHSIVTGPVTGSITQNNY